VAALIDAVATGTTDPTEEPPPTQPPLEPPIDFWQAHRQRQQVAADGQEARRALEQGALDQAADNFMSVDPTTYTAAHTDKADLAAGTTMSTASETALAGELTAEAILRLGLYDRSRGPAHLRRGLRTRCKELGILAEGTTVELRQRLAAALDRKLPAGHTRWAPPTKPAAKSRRLEPRRRQNTPTGRAAKLAHRSFHASSPNAPNVSTVKPR
jgi:hypothetical protein